LLGGIFNLDEVFLLVGEVFEEVVEKLGELFDGFFRDTNRLGSEELDEDGTELGGLLGLDHLDEGLVEVVGELDQTGRALGELFKNGEDSVDGFDGGVKFFLNNVCEDGVFSVSLDGEVLDDSVDSLNVSLSLGQISFGGGEGIFRTCLGQRWSW